MKVGEACFGKKPANEELTGTHYAVLLHLSKAPNGIAMKISQAIPATLDEPNPPKRPAHKWTQCMMALVDLYSTGFILRAALDGDPEGWPITYSLTPKGAEALDARLQEVIAWFMDEELADSVREEDQKVSGVE